MKYTNYILLIIINLLLAYNIYSNTNINIKTNIKTNNKETFIDDYNEDILLEDNNLKGLDNETDLFNEFCSKINYINNNFNNLSREYIILHNLYINKLNQSKKITNKLIQDILDYQKKIYNNEDEITYYKNYSNQLNDNSKEEIEILNKSIKKLKDNYNGELIVNVE